MVFARLILILVTTFSVVSTKTFAQAAGADQGFILLPTLSYNTEQGTSFGAQYIYQGVLGTQWESTGSFRYAPDKNVSALNFGLLDRKLFDKIYTAFNISYYYSAQSLFYGFGNQTTNYFPTQYSVLDTIYSLKMGIEVVSNVIAGLTYAQNTLTIGRGPDNGTPNYLDQYSPTLQFNATTMKTIGGFVSYKTFAPEYAPDSGRNVQFSYEHSTPYAPNEPQFDRMNLSYTEIFGVGDFRLLPRFVHERVWGGDLPFFMQARIGGKNSVRAYPFGRFSDFASVLYGGEARYPLFQPGGFIQKVEVSFGLETGRVYNSGTIGTLVDQLHTGYDYGLTAVIAGGIPLRFDDAVGPEGNQIYMHLFYPF